MLDPCAALQVRRLPLTHTLVLTGHHPNGSDNVSDPLSPKTVLPCDGSSVLHNGFNRSCLSAPQCLNWQRWSTTVPTAFSCVSCWTRSTPCLSVSWMPWWPTSFPSAAKNVFFLCCGIRASSPWPSATRLTWPRSRRKRCWSCSGSKPTLRSQQRFAESCRTLSREMLKLDSLLQSRWTDSVCIAFLPSAINRLWLLSC